MERFNIEEMYNKYFKTVYRFLLALTSNPDIAEELTQETFYKAMIKINTYRKECKLSTWLCQIAKNLWLNELKKQNKIVSMENDNIELMKIQSNLEDDFLEEQDKQELYAKINKLDDDTKHIFFLKLSGNFTFKEIGEILGKSEVWARVNFYRGKQKLKEVE